MPEDRLGIWAAIIEKLGYKDEPSMWEDLYINQELSIATIARILSVGSATVNRRIRLCGIPTRSRGGAKNYWPMRRNIFRYDQRLLYSLPVDEVSMSLNIPANIIAGYKRDFTGGKIDAILHNFADSGVGPVF